MIVKVSASGKPDLTMSHNELAKIFSIRFKADSIDLFFADLPQKGEKSFTLNNVTFKVSYVSEE